MCNRFSVGIIIYNPDKYSLIISPRTCASSRLKPFIQSPAFASPFRVFRVSRLAAIWSRLCFKYSISLSPGRSFASCLGPVLFPVSFPDTIRRSVRCPSVSCLSRSSDSHGAVRTARIRFRARASRSRNGFTLIAVRDFPFSNSVSPRSRLFVSASSRLLTPRSARKALCSRFGISRTFESAPAIPPDTPEAPDISCPRVSFSRAARRNTELSTYSKSAVSSRCCFWSIWKNHKRNRHI